MQISTNQDSLIKPLSMLNNIVERRQTLPILSNILFKVKNNILFLTATDLEIEMSTQIAVIAEQDSEFTLPARKLMEIVKNLPKESEIKLSIDEKKAKLTSGKGKYIMSILSSSDYPSIQATKSTDTFEISQENFKKLIEKTAFSMAQQDVRYYLNGLLIEIQSGKMRAVATDGHRLALSEMALDIEVEEKKQIILPRKAVLELGRLLENNEDLIQVSFNQNYINIKIGHSSFTSKLIDGKFPEYELVIPADKKHQITVDKQILRQALIRTSIFSNEKYRGVGFDIDQNIIRLQANNPENDEAIEELEVKYTGDKLKIGFNVSYLLDVINIIDTEEVKMVLEDEESSFLITPIDTDDCCYVIMPMRL